MIPSLRRPVPSRPARRRRPLVLALALAAIAFASAALAQDAAPAAAGVAGVWQGAIEIPGSPLAVVVTFSEGEGGEIAGAIDIPAQGAAGLPLEVRREGGALVFAIQGVPGEPTFEGERDGDALTGTFTQSGQAFPFTLERGGDAVAAAEPATDGIYRDPEGRFRLPIPTNWSLQEGDGFVTLLSPDAGIRVHALAFPTAGDDGEGEIEARITESWRRVSPDGEPEVDDRLEPPPDPGVERTVATIYDAGDDRVAQALGQRAGDGVYVLLLDADLAALQRRGSQANIALSGFEIEGLERTDLSDTPALPFSDDMAAALEAFIEEGLERYGIPGAAVAVVQGGEVVYSEGFGATAVGGEPITPDTHMMIGSTGKTLTTMLMATLIDAGRMDWETPVRELLPEFAVADPELSERFTVRNLVCACSGVPRRDFELLFNAAELSAEDVVASLAGFEFFTDFGEAFQYSNQLVGTGGYVAAAADGAPWGELFAGYAASLQARVLTPIGMADTTLSFDAVAERGRYATPHQLTLAGAYEALPLEVERTLLPIAPAGAHWSTASDMARYLQTALARGVAPDGARVVSEENLRTTWAPQVPVSADSSYGLGWLVGEVDGLRLLSHGGNTLGFTSEFAFLPERDLGIVVLTNAQASNAFNGSVRERLFELVFDLPERAAADAAFAFDQFTAQFDDIAENLLELDRAALEPRLGRYRNDALGEVALTFSEGAEGTGGGELLLDIGEFALRIRGVDDDGETSYLLDGAPFTGVPLEFADAEGTSTFVLGGGAVAYTFERIP